MSYEIASLLWVAAFIAGVRSSWRLYRTYRRVHAAIEPRNRPLIQTIVAISIIVTVAAGYFGALSVRRMLGFEPLAWVAPLSALVAAVVLLIPVALDFVLNDRIAKSGGDPPVIT